MTDILKRLDCDCDCKVCTFKDAKAEIERLRAALREISERHVPDQPSCLDIDEADYIRRHHTELRRIARAALGDRA